MPRDRLQSSLWVSAALRKVSAAGDFAAVVNKGEPESGTLVVRLNLLDGTSRLLSETRDLDGNLGWLPPLGKDPLPDVKVDEYIQRAISRDPDLWIVEVETKAGENPFGGDEIS